MKKASQLTQGDVIVIDGKPKYIVLSTPTEAQDYRGVYNVHVWEIAVGWSTTVLFSNDADKEVMTPLTPAQQHADELLAFVRHVAANGGRPVLKGQFAEEANELLDKIKPVEPPTVDELVRALAETRERTETIDALLDRARKAGML